MTLGRITLRKLVRSYNASKLSVNEKLLSNSKSMGFQWLLDQYWNTLDERRLCTKSALMYNILNCDQTVMKVVLTLPYKTINFSLSGHESITSQRIDSFVVNPSKQHLNLQINRMCAKLFISGLMCCYLITALQDSENTATSLKVKSLLFPLFSKCACVSATYFASVCTSTHRMEPNKNGSEQWNECHCESACTTVKYAPNRDLVEGTIGRNKYSMVVYIYWMYRILHGKCARTVFTHELWRIRNRTSERRELVRFLIQNNGCVNTVQSTFHVVLCL